MSLLKRQTGYSLVQLMIGIGISSIVALGLASVVRLVSESQSKSDLSNKLQLFKQNMLTNLKSDAAWRVTVQKNVASGGASGMGCLLDSNLPCSPGGDPILQKPFALYDSNGELVFDATDSTAGFTYQLQPCNGSTHPPGFNEATGNDKCPFRYEMKWEASCSGGDLCKNPRVIVSAPLKYKPSNSGHKTSINTDQYSIKNVSASHSVCGVNNKIYADPGSYKFKVPDEFSQMVVEVWGGGAGGSVVLWTCGGNFGGAGGESSFGSYVKADGGAPGTRSSSYTQEWFIICNMGSCAWVIPPTTRCGPRSFMGGNADLGDLNPFPKNQNSCDVNVGRVGGVGGLSQVVLPILPTASPPLTKTMTNPKVNGSAIGGGGAGMTGYASVFHEGWPCIGGISFCWGHYRAVTGGEGGQGGRYKQVVLRRSDIAKTVTEIDVVVGKGGAGGSGAIVGRADNAGNGAPGLVKISWW